MNVITNTRVGGAQPAWQDSESIEKSDVEESVGDRNTPTTTEEIESVYPMSFKLCGDNSDKTVKRSRDTCVQMK